MMLTSSQGVTGVTRCNTRCNKFFTVLDGTYTVLLHLYTYFSGFPCEPKIKTNQDMFLFTRYTEVGKTRCTGVTDSSFKRHPQQNSCYTLVTPCYTFPSNTVFTPSPTQNRRCNSHE